MHTSQQGDLEPPPGFIFKKIDDIHAAVKSINAAEIDSVWHGIRRQAGHFVGADALYGSVSSSSLSR